MAGSLRQLQDELEAITEALEGLAAGDQGLAPVAPVAGPADEAPSGPVRVR
jgi:hypothetical protein